MNPFLRTKALCLAAYLACTGPAQAQQFEIEDGVQGRAGIPVGIELRGLPPGAEVEIRAQRTLKHYYRRGQPHLQYQSGARFNADADGRISLADSEAISGSYAGIDASGLFWSMQPTSEASVSPDASIHLQALIDGAVVATASFELPSQSSSIEIEEIASLPGSYFARHPGPGERPAIIIVDGVDDLRVNREILMPRLVEEGYSVLHFATYALVYGPFESSTPELPSRYVDIPVDRLQEAHDWLVEQPGVDAERIGLYGFSRNGAYVVLAATRFPWIEAVAGISPSDVVWEGWGEGVRLGTTTSYTWEGEALAYVPYSENFFRETAKLARGEAARLRTPMDEGRWANPDRIAEARIPIETYDGALFLAGGEQDNVWSAGHMVQNMAERRAEAGLSTEFLVLPDAGHNIIHDGWNPTLLFETGEARAFEAQGQSQTWQATLAFLNDALDPSSY